MRLWTLRCYIGNICRRFDTLLVAYEPPQKLLESKDAAVRASMVK